MASSHKGSVGDSLESSKMSFVQKRKLVYKLSENPDIALKVLKAWTCDEIRQILCVESEKERRYTGLTKDELIRILLETVSEKNIEDREVEERNSSPKRQRKDLDPLNKVTPSAKTKGKGTICCRNWACQAILLRGKDTFCKRCSCCICYKYDQNKDPSLWLTCNSDPPFDGESCGFSCHLECAFNSERSGLKVDKPTIDVDGCFFCVLCGKKNSLLGCWKKQMMIAMETEEVSKLCHCLILAQKLLKGTEKYKELSELVEKAAKSLVAGLDLETSPELRGSLLDLPLSKCKGSINRLDSTATDVKNHCASALKLLDSLPLPSKMQGLTNIKFEEVLATTLTLVLESAEASSTDNNITYSVWHRKVSDTGYPNELTCALSSPNTRFVVSELTPATEYCFKVVSFCGAKELSIDESNVSTQTSREEEVVVTILDFSSLLSNCSNPPPHSLETEPNSEGKRVILQTDSDVRQMEQNTSSEERQLVLAITPLSSNQRIDHQDRSEKAKRMEKSANCGLCYEHCVKVIRQLECSGYLKSDFRQKFLTWYSLRASTKEKHVVKTFVKCFEDDSAALAEQLIDTFSGCISRKRSAIGGGDGSGGSGASGAVSAGLCRKPKH